MPAGACRVRSGARGIVLVMILGILAVMVIMAVSFAVAMRTERVAAANAAENIRMRMLLDIALVRAIEDMRLDLTNQIYPLWDVRVSKTPPDNACAGMGVAFDDFTNGAVMVRAGVTNYGLLYGDAANHIPLAFLGAALGEDLMAWPYTNTVIEPVGQVTNIVAPRWVPVVEPFSMLPPGTNQWAVVTNDVGGVPVVMTNVTSRVLGRVGWVTVNCSGLLDANFVGGLPRTNGTVPREIRLANLPEIGNEALFLAQRDANVRYDTLHDLDRKNQAALVSFPSNLFIYSFALSGYVTGFSTNTGVVQPVSVAGDAAALAAQRSAITNMFGQMGFSGLEAAQLFTNLLDYVDGDALPRLPNTLASSEAMPLLNEVTVTNWYRRDDLGGGNFRYNISNSIQVELWYPYASVPAAPLDVVSNRIRIAFSGTAGWVPANPPDTWLTMSLTPNGYYVSAPIATTLSRDPAPPAQIVCLIDINNDTFVNNAQQRIGPAIRAGFTNNTGGAAASTRLNFECIDPRLGNASGMWSNSLNHTLGQLNQLTRNYWIANPGCDSNTLYFCANTGLLSVVELGNLPLASQPWRSVALFGPNRHAVIDRFSVATNSGATNVFRGLVNPNSTQRDVLASVFNGMPIEEYPGGPPSGTLPWADAQALATTLIASWPYTNLSDIGRANWDGFFAVCSVANQLDTTLKRETFLRNVMGLLNARQNVFTIVLAAELAGQDNDRFPRLAIRQRAVAIVWRDPYLNRFFIRSVKYLPD